MYDAGVASDDSAFFNNEIQSNYPMFSFSDEFVLDAWAIISDAKCGRMPKKKQYWPDLRYKHTLGLDKFYFDILYKDRLLILYWFTARKDFEWTYLNASLSFEYVLEVLLKFYCALFNQ